MGERKAGLIKPAAEGQVLMIQARDQVWGKFGLAEVKALERGGRGKKSAISPASRRQRMTVESPERQLAYRGARFFVLLNWMTTCLE